MRRFTICLTILCAFFLTAHSVFAQSKLSLNPGVDFVSRYIWRGVDFGNSPAIQPELELDCGGFAFGAWGSYVTNDANFQESDLYVSYTVKDMLTFTVSDYFFPDGTIANNMYFDYDYSSTGHIFEGAVSFNGTEKIPLSLMVAVNFAGADARTNDNKLQYSNYFELGYSTSVDKTSLDFFLGGTLTKPDKSMGEAGYYGPHEGIINVGITAGREIPVTEKFTLPLNFSLITNPQQQNIFFVLGISL